MAFLEAYYQFLEQNESTLAEGQVVDRAKNLLDYKDIDSTIDSFADKLHKKFMDDFPINALADRRTILKHIKDFYRAKGSEKSYRFLMRALYNKEIDFYYPKNDVLRASDGKWFIQKSLRVQQTQVNGVANNFVSGLELYVNRLITGNTSNASAVVESVDRYFTDGFQVDELVLSGIVGTFQSEEGVSVSFSKDGTSYNVDSAIIGSVVNALFITESGSGYHVGDPVIVLHSTGTGACVAVATVSTGNVRAVLVNEGGVGFRAGDYLNFTSSYGSGANGQLTVINTDERYHPNTYNIWITLISQEANTNIGNSIYSNLNAALVDPANNWIQNSLSHFVYSNTGPALIIEMNNAGSGYSENPTISILANTRIRELGILGKMNVVNGGTGYAVNDLIEFTNVTGGFGVGALANVTGVHANGAISSVRFKNMTGHVTGGAGYDMNFLPRANVINTLGTGVNANVMVDSLLGYGGTFNVVNSTIGSIETLRIFSGGRNYTNAPTLDLSGSGDGTAEAYATVLSGVYTYPGRYLNDDGHLSSYNYLQDRDYYQNFSYVVRVKESIERYRYTLKQLVHPAGMKLFGEYLEVNENQANAEVVISTSSDAGTIRFKQATYVKTGNTINIAYASHNANINSTVYLGFTENVSIFNVSNGIYAVTGNSGPNYFTVKQKSNLYSITINNAGRLYNANSYLIFTGDGAGANATYTINANGSLVSVNVAEYGAGFTRVPTVTANGSNSVAATFDVVISYANNTSGTVEAGFST